MKTYTVYLIRHGRESRPGEVRYVGRTDLPLTDAGVAELQALVAQEPYPPVQAVYTGPLLRCRQTAEILYPHLPATPVEGLTECDFGAFENKTPQELKDDPAYAEWLSGGDPPGGESNERFFKRTVVAFAALMEQVMAAGQTEIALCLHGGSIMAILAQCGLPQRKPSDWFCQPGHGFVMRITPGVWMRGYKAEVVAQF